MGVFGRNAKGFVPNRENAGDSAAGTLADVDHRKHFEDCGVTRVRHSAVNSLLDADAERARILKRETVFVFFDNDAATSIIIGICKSVQKNFSDCLVDGGVVNSCDSFQNKRTLDVFGKFVENFEKEVENVAAPFART